MAEETLNKQEALKQLAKLVGITDAEVSNYVAGVVRTGDKIILPENAQIPDVINVLQRKHQEETQNVTLRTEFAAPPWDGAMAVEKAIEQELGVVITNETKGWFGDNPTQEIEVEVEYGKTRSVKWGEFALPGMGEAKAVTGIGQDASGLLTFQCAITCKRRFQDRAKKLLEKMRSIALVESLHKGKAFAIEFLDHDGDRISIPTPKFFPLDGELPLFRRELEQAVERNVFTPIRHTQALREMGESLKRGVLFAGPYGVGKTLLAGYVAREVVKHGWTFLYCKNPVELPYALAYAARYQPVVVFVEDVDRVAGIERTDQVNNLLNQLDGVDSKNSQIMTILTSNHSEKVNAAMRRPGRIDLVLQVLPPDEETITRMAHAFSRSGLEPGSDLTDFATTLVGLAPAYIKEAVSRARLEALRRTGRGDALISGEDLAVVAREVKAEKDLFAPKEEKDVKDSLTKIADGFEEAASMFRGGNKKAKPGSGIRAN